MTGTLALSCSDGGGPGSITTDTLFGVVPLSGVVLSDGTASGNAHVMVGDVDANTPQLNSRAFLTFDLTTIPAGKILRSARLRIFQDDIVGSPYAKLGDLLVDHLVYGSSLDPADYDAAELSRGFTVLSTDSTRETKVVSVLQRIQADINAGRTVSQFRLRFTIDTNDDAMNDFTEFMADEIVEITYER